MYTIKIKYCLEFFKLSLKKKKMRKRWVTITICIHLKIFMKKIMNKKNNNNNNTIELPNLSTLRI